MRSVEGVDFLTEYAMSREERLVSIRGEYVDNLLFDALLSVADETPLRKMTVSQVAACAGVSRQTFYNHFADINELISWCPFHFLESRSFAPYDVEAVRASYEFALEHKGFFSQLPSHTGQNNFRESFVRYSNELICGTCIGDDLADDERLRRTMMIDMFSHGIVGLFLDWCATGLAWPIESLLEAQEQALPDFVRDESIV